ncbi:MAG: hypothetical protein EOP06_19290, partial [Proteobacteria bacterium]
MAICFRSFRLRVQNFLGDPLAKKQIYWALSFFGIAIVVAVCVATFYPKAEKTASSFKVVPPNINKDPLVLDQKRGVASDQSKVRRAPRRKDSILLRLKDNATPKQLAALQALYKKFDLKHDKKLLKGKALRLKISLADLNITEEQISAAILASGAVKYAEPDYLAPLALVPNDPDYSWQWHHQTVKSEIAWNYTQGSSNVLVAVCDSGFDVRHPDLIAAFQLPGYNTVYDNTTLTTLNEHGTLTSGTIAAVGNNANQIAGMTWKNKILPIQVSDVADGSAAYSDIAECIQYASDRGAKVVSISYDYTYASTIILDAAQALRNKGGLVVAASGNSTVDISPYGANPSILIVGATDNQDRYAYFSNYGSNVDIYAPGVDIYTTGPSGLIYTVSGTSFATPMVAGAAALIYSLKPTFTPDQVEGFLLGKAGNVNGNPGLLMNAGASVQAAAAT